MQTINWGIIGCGDVTEVKSGPAFNKVPNSTLVAVMRRDAAKAKDYAQRHGVSKWYSDAAELINDPEVTAIYIATPPGSHAQYALAAIEAGKPVYVEKPMALDFNQAQEIAIAAEKANVPLVVAHYRRQWPLFQQIKSLLATNTIGAVRLIRLEYYQTPLTPAELALDKTAWRLNPAIAGGGLFHDLAPHQLDIMYYLFGDTRQLSGFAANQAGQYAADDLVIANVLFNNTVAFSGTWSFAAPYNKDYCEIIGSKGSIAFSFFSSNGIDVRVGDAHTHIDVAPLQHVQQPMIEQVVRYFRGEAPNPCTGREGAEVMRWIDSFTRSR